MACLDVDMRAALATAREMGATGWAAAELLLAMRTGLGAGSATRRADHHPTDAGGVTHGG
jgi:hypothetical protein